MKRLALIVAGVAVLIAAGIAVVRRSTPQPPAQQASSSRSQPTSSLEDALSTIRRGIDLESCRSLVMQVNGYLAENSSDAPASLTADEKRLLTDQFFLDPEELQEVESRAFTPLDAQYLEDSFFLVDGLRSLRLESERPLDQATQVFAWLMRQVRLREQERDLLPPVFVLQRSWGSTLERAALFTRALGLLGIESCVVAVPYSKQDQGLRYWVVGALIDGRIYLFDTRMGMPVPGPGGKGIATLAQARSDPKILSALSSKEFPYDVNAEDLKRAEVHVASTLSALSPRMRYLEGKLPATERTHLSSDPQGLLQHFSKAVEAPALAGVKVKVWNHPGDNRTPIRSLRGFLTPDEGGTDRRVPNLRQEARFQMVPWSLLAPELQSVQGPLGELVRTVYADPFFNFYVEPSVPRPKLLTWLPGLADSQPRGPGDPVQVRKDVEGTLSGRMPRDLLLRGGVEEAAGILAIMEAELQRQRQAKKAALAEPGAFAVSAEGAQKGAPPAPAPTSPRERDEQQRREAARVAIIVQGFTADVLVGEVIYQLALAKQELAERAQARVDLALSQHKQPRLAEKSAAQAAWTTAAGWWETYLNGDGPRLTPSAARAHLARARLCLGNKDGARTLLEDLNGELSPLEKTGRLYRASHLED